MIELDQDDGAVDAVVEHAVRCRVADPREPRVVQMALDFRHLHLRVALIHVADVQLDQVDQLPTLRRRQFGDADASIVQHEVVLKRFGQVVVAGFGEVEDGLLPMGIGQPLDDREPWSCSSWRTSRALIRARRGQDRFRPREVRGHDHLVAEDEVVDDGVMAVELPAPRLGGRGLAQHRDEVQPFAQKLMIVRELGQRFVQAHDVARELQPLRAERRAHEAEGRLALRLGHLLEADALAHVEVLVHPFAPFGIVDGKQRPGALLGGEDGEELLRRLADRGGGTPVD